MLLSGLVSSIENRALLCAAALKNDRLVATANVLHDVIATQHGNAGALHGFG